MKKYIFVATEYPPVGGGSGIVAKQVINDSIKLKLNNFDYYISNKNFKFKVLNFFKLFMIYRDMKAKKDFSIYDVIILNDNDSILIAGLFFSDELLKKCRVVIHGDFYNKYLINIRFKDRIRFYNYAFKRVLLNSRKNICVSEYIKEGFLKNFPSLTSKTFVFYCGTNFSERISYRNKISKKCSYKLLSVSRIEKSKGYYEKLQLFIKLKEIVPNLSWDIVGKGSYLDELKKLVKRSRLEKSIKFHGYLAGDDLIHMYKSSDFFWLLPNIPEAFGLVYIEAQSLGLPSIGRNIGGISEALEPNKSLILNGNELNENADKILKFILSDIDGNELASSIRSKFNSISFCLALTCSGNFNE